MKHGWSALIVGCMLLGAPLTAPLAGTITVQNLSSSPVSGITIFKGCQGSLAPQVFGAIDPGTAQTQPRTTPIVGGCLYAIEIGEAARFSTCNATTFTLPDPREPDHIVITFDDTAELIEGAPARTCEITAGSLPPRPAPPSSPVNLRTAMDGEDGSTPSLALIWDDASANEDIFRLERRIGSGAFQEIAVLSPDTTVFLETGVLDLPFTYRIRACNADGCSPFSSEASITPR